jgi:hypothetical protein
MRIFGKKTKDYEKYISDFPVEFFRRIRLGASFRTNYYYYAGGGMCDVPNGL